MAALHLFYIKKEWVQWHFTARVQHASYPRLEGWILLYDIVDPSSHLQDFCPLPDLTYFEPSLRHCKSSYMTCLTFRYAQTLKNSEKLKTSMSFNKIPDCMLFFTLFLWSISFQYKISYLFWCIEIFEVH